MTPDVMLEELAWLPDDLPRLALEFANQLVGAAPAAVLRDVIEVLVVGSGDSLHAAMAGQLAFHAYGGVIARALSVHEFATYAREWLEPRPLGRRLVVVVSASGRTPGALASADEARARGVPVACVAGDGSSPLVGRGDLTLSYDLPGRMRSPGIRTYQASLTALLQLAARIGVLGGRVTPAQGDGVTHCLRSVADGLRRADKFQRKALDAAGRLSGGPFMFLGAGPHRGTAKHAAAKVIEASGILAVGQELEEWWHVERMADPADMSIFVIVTERSAVRATQIAAAAQARGRRVFIVAPWDAPPVLDGCPVLPVAPGVPEELSPLAYQGFGVHVAADLARELGRRAFEGGNARAPRDRADGR